MTIVPYNRNCCEKNSIFVATKNSTVKISSLQVLQYNAQGAIVKDSDDYIDALDSCGVVLPTAEHTDNES